MTSEDYTGDSRLRRAVSLTIEAIDRIPSAFQRIVYLCELAKAIFELGSTAQPRELLEASLGIVDLPGNPAMRQSALVSLAAVLCDCGMTDRAVAISEKVDAMLRPDRTLVAALNEASLVTVIVRLGREAWAKELTDRIADRTRTANGLREFFRHHLLRAHLAVGDLAAAQRLVDEQGAYHRELSMLLASLDILHTGAADAATLQRSQWLESQDPPIPAVLSVLLLLYTRLGTPEKIHRIWSRMEALFLSGPSRKNVLPASIGFLVFSKLGAAPIPPLLCSTLEASVNVKLTLDLNPFERSYLARYLAATDRLADAMKLHTTADSGDKEGVLGAILRQLIEDCRLDLALSIAGSAEVSLRSRLLARFGCEVLKNKESLERFDVTAFAKALDNSRGDVL